MATGVTGAVLSLFVGYFHIVDQGGFPGDKEPRYIGIGYYALEFAALALAVLLVTGRQRTAGWLLALGVAVGPLAGYVLSRGPGLPNYSDDKGNWTEPLLLKSVAVELLLGALALVCLLRDRTPSSARASD
ncbi:MAG: hypothetical protein H7323_12890 [Frankiales bacterium]|nr:hypothetical protein [Frankiales bacterium]